MPVSRPLEAHPLLCFNVGRRHYREVVVGEGELFCSPDAHSNDLRNWRSPLGEFDLPDFVRALPAPWNKPSLFVARVDAAMSSVPRNISPLDCPKLLLVGDTHHQGAAITRLLDYALAEPFDLVVGEYDRHHLHFFAEAGLRNVAWLPSFTLSPYELAPAANHSQPLAFFGSTGAYHPYRNAVLQQLETDGFPLFTGSGTRQQAAECYNRALISLNVSLNGDLNLRVFEVLAAGGFLITDRLSVESGLPLLFEPGKELVTFETPQELQELITGFLARPDEAMAIAQAGQARYLKQHRPQEKIRQLLSLMARGGLSHPEYDVRLDGRTRLPAERLPLLRQRIAVYELLQELHRVNPSLDVLFWPGAERVASDAVDLPRLRVSMMSSETADPGINAILEGRVGWTTDDDLGARRWNLLLCKAGDLSAPHLQALLRRRFCDGVVVTDDLDDAAGRPVAELGLEPFNHRPRAFSFRQ
ncbi:MAG: glycosyltransferase family 1 protein [Betaproteobacteria bacterium]|nr:glycosyltransferase family 1 protein [Betaproteobacteria bacterium]